MKRQPHPPFSMLELLKMVRRLDDSINKIQRAADKLAQDKNPREIIALSQAVQNLIKVRDRLAVWAEESLKRDTEKTLKRVKEILEKTHPKNSNSWNIKNFKEFSQ